MLRRLVLPYKFKGTPVLSFVLEPCAPPYGFNPTMAPVGLSHIKIPGRIYRNIMHAKIYSYLLYEN